MCIFDRESKIQLSSKRDQIAKRGAMVLTNCLQMPGCGIGVGVMSAWMCVCSVGMLVCECMVVWVCGCVVVWVGGRVWRSIDVQSMWL